jgi:hypothetical protein
MEASPASPEDSKETGAFHDNLGGLRLLFVALEDSLGASASLYRITKQGSGRRWGNLC